MVKIDFVTRKNVEDIVDEKINKKFNILAHAIDNLRLCITDINSILTKMLEAQIELEKPKEEDNKSP